MARVLRWLMPLLFCFCTQSFLQRQTQGDPPSTATHSSDAWFQQKLDHFSKKRSRFWQQRYYMNDAFYKRGGPVFLMTGGPVAANIDWISQKYTWMVYAERLGALCFFLEHRFYGQSQPTGDLSTSSLQYLSSRQALADIAYFRTKIAKEMGLSKNKWVTFGGFYGGSLAVWSRIKHPKLFAAAVGSSAPIKAKLDFYEYFETIHRTLKKHKRMCSVGVKKALTVIVKMLKTPQNYSKLEDDFKLCKPLKISSVMDRTFFLDALIKMVAYVVQNNGDNKLIKVEQNGITIDGFCDVMTNRSLGSSYYRYAKFENMMLKNRNQTCLCGNYNDYLEVMVDSSLRKQNLKEGIMLLGKNGNFPFGIEKKRQWLYQCCTEFGFFQTMDLKNKHNSNLPLRYFIKQCSDVFGLDFKVNSLARAVSYTNEYYGGFNVNGSKIILPNGSTDPWHVLGITKKIHKKFRAVFIKGGTHMADMFVQTDFDSTELLQAREKIFQILKKWLKL
ncbi:PREDICTED: putative serine protease K12H4.7-like [Chrysochloris asiatica]|uniref:Serine protease K12H4.7-like n=1 Tax=Chrysochloris asiatica TaxID=185453 RepID=A0A9B0WLG6_CHRAS|nr:PREDICTED: putative serine protease K12H4.7-like [Chrysochloris asiatica]